MSGPTRRSVLGGALLGGLAAAATVGWTGRAGATARASVRLSAERVRPGAALTLSCSAADAFALTFGDGPRRVMDAPRGTLRLGAPRGWSAQTWTPLRIVPLADGRPIGPPAEVQVFTRAPIYGA